MGSKNRGRFILFSLVLAHNCFAQKPWNWIVSTGNANLGLPISINPDACNLRVGKIGGRWNNNVGGEIGLTEFKSPNVEFGLLLGGFINMHDMDNQQAFSWQIWRGSIQFSSFLKFNELDKRLGKGNRIIIENMWAHESQHATDLFGYNATFTKWNPYYFPNGTIRSFNYMKNGIHFIHSSSNEKWILDCNMGYKYFYVPPNLENAYDMLNHAFLGEVGIQRRLFNGFYAYSKLYYESINNNFDAKLYHYQGNWNKEPFQYRIAEIGFYKTNKILQRLNVYFMYSFSNGRGFDFPEVAKLKGLGLRIAI